MGRSLSIKVVYGGVLDGGKYNDEFPWVEQGGDPRDWIGDKYNTKWYSMDRTHGISFVDYSWGDDRLPFVIGITESRIIELEDGIIGINLEKLQVVPEEWNQRLNQFETITGLRFKNKGWFACASFF